MHSVRLFKIQSSSILMRLKAKQIRSFFNSAKPFKITKKHVFYTKFASGRDIVKKTNRVVLQNLP